MEYTSSSSEDSLCPRPKSVKMECLERTMLWVCGVSEKYFPSVFAGGYFCDGPNIAQVAASENARAQTRLTFLSYNRKMFYVYVLRSLKDNQFYTGYTSALRKRVKEHFSGESFATKTRLPFEIIYYEAHRNKKGALSRERFLKTGWGRNYLKKILKNFLDYT